MLKDEQNIIVISIIVGIASWIIDALIDSFLFSKGSFWAEVMLRDTYEFYMRSLFVLVIILFGILLAGFVFRRKKLESARIAAEKVLRESENRIHTVMESIADSIYMVDAECRFLFMNKKHIERLGLTAQGFIGRAYSDFHSPEDTKELIESVDNVFKTGSTIQKEHISRNDNRHFLRTFSPVKDGDAKITAVTIVSKDINDLKMMEKKLRDLSLTDELTGLYNRRGFFTMVEPLLKLARRHENPVFLLYADLDNLKEINDVFGHHEGDRAITDTASVLKATFRETDIVARIGGDEFVVIPVAGKKDDADKITSRFKEYLCAHNAKNDRSYKLSISMGMSCYDLENPVSVDGLLKQAEKLMYEEKMLKKTGVEQDL